MGIFAKGSQFPATVEADTPQNRYGGQFTKDSSAGDALGETLGEVNATASSANTTTGAIIDDIEALEERVDALEAEPSPDLSGYATNTSVDKKVTDALGVTTVSGNGWVARKQGRVVVLVLTNVAATFTATLPTGYRPIENVYAPVVDFGANSSPLVRVGVITTGAMSIMNGIGACYGTITYMTN